VAMTKWNSARFHHGRLFSHRHSNLIFESNQGSAEAMTQVTGGRGKVAKVLGLFFFPIRSLKLR